jgi:hypothetical protein
VLVCSERKVLLAGCWWLVCSERKVLLAGGWFVLREKYCWLVADKPSEQAVGANPTLLPHPITMTDGYPNSKSCFSCVTLSLLFYVLNLGCCFLGSPARLTHPKHCV